LKEVGFADTSPGSIQLGSSGVGLKAVDPLDFGLCEGDSTLRYSSISEPKDVLSSCREKISKPNTKSRRQKSSTKFNKLGVPKCIHFAGSIKEAATRARRRRHKGRGLQRSFDEAGSEGDIPFEEGLMEGSNGGGEDAGWRKKKNDLAGKKNGVTPSLGVNNLLSDSENSRKSDSSSHKLDDDREKVLQAAKLLSIQKGVGFTFEVPEADTIMQLVDQEKCDRAKKMEWETKEGDQ
jgi:hypothetical protein